MAFYSLPLKNCILYKGSSYTWPLPKAFVKECHSGLLTLAVLVCPVLTHLKHCPWCMEYGVSLIIGRHGNCPRCVLRFVVLSVEYGIFRGAAAALSTSVL